MEALAQAIGISVVAVNNHINELKKIEFISHSGPLRGGCWDIFDDNVKLFVKEHYTNVTKMSPKCHQNVALNVQLDVAVELTNRQQYILNLIATNVQLYVQLNTAKIAEILNIGQKTVQRELTILRDNKLIERKGGSRYGYWVIPDKNENEIR